MTALKELEQLGYLERHQLRAANGRLGKVEYVIYEMPKGVFRVEKNRGYTVMSNHHLRNKDLSLKAKGLLSQMLSLPEDWDYTLKGLSLINRESIDAIRTAVWELEKAGYITRQQNRDGKGKMADMVYMQWLIDHDFAEPTDRDARLMDIEVSRQMCDVWGELYVLTLREWLDGQ